MRYIIENARICDGTGEVPYMGTLLLENDKISKIMKQKDGLFPRNKDAVYIDAQGKYVTPGFIDTHRHCDLAALYDENFGELELAQGLTSIVGGNCGLGIFPGTREYAREIYNFVEPCLGIIPREAELWSCQSYMNALEEKGVPLHVGCYQGLGALKAAVKGYGKKAFTREEMEEAKEYLTQALRAGCVGVSSGIMYQPECYSSKEEMIELLKAASPYNRPLACHIRGEGDTLVESVKEIIEICKRAEIPLNISHFKSTGLKNWGKKIFEAIDAVEKARSQGQDVTVDFYPYCGGSTTLLSLLPPDIMEESLKETFQKLETSQGREKLRTSLYKEHKGWDNMVTAIGWERIVISSVTKADNKDLIGKNFREGAKLRGYEEPVYFMAELTAMEEGKVGIIVLSMSQEDVDTVARLPYSMLISDGLYGISDAPHPRLYGAFPQFLQDYVVERKIFSIQEAVRKMTFLPAERLRLEKRGLLREGYFADLNIFDLQKFKAHAVYGDSKKLCTGLSYVFVDGRIVWKDGQKQNGYNAKLLQI